MYHRGPAFYKRLVAVFAGAVLAAGCGYPVVPVPADGAARAGPPEAPRSPASTRLVLPPEPVTLARLEADAARRLRRWEERHYAAFTRAPSPAARRAAESARRTLHDEQYAALAAYEPTPAEAPALALALAQAQADRGARGAAMTRLQELLASEPPALPAVAARYELAALLAAEDGDVVRARAEFDALAATAPDADERLLAGRELVLAELAAGDVAAAAAAFDRWQAARDAAGRDGALWDAPALAARLEWRRAHLGRRALLLPETVTLDGAPWGEPSEGDARPLLLVFLGPGLSPFTTDPALDPDLPAAHEGMLRRRFLALGAEDRTHLASLRAWWGWTDPLLVAAAPDEEEQPSEGADAPVLPIPADAPPADDAPWPPVPAPGRFSTALIDGRGRLRACDVYGRALERWIARVLATEGE